MQIDSIHSVTLFCWCSSPTYCKHHLQDDTLGDFQWWEPQSLSQHAQATIYLKDLQWGSYAWNALPPNLSPNQMTLVILGQYQCHCFREISLDTQCKPGIFIINLITSLSFHLCTLHNLWLSCLIISLRSILFNHHNSPKKD